MRHACGGTILFSRPGSYSSIQPHLDRDIYSQLLFHRYSVTPAALLPADFIGAVQAIVHADQNTRAAGTTQLPVASSLSQPASDGVELGSSTQSVSWAIPLIPTLPQTAPLPGSGA